MEGGYFEESKIQNMTYFTLVVYVIISNVFIQRAFSGILQCKSVK